MRGKAPRSVCHSQRGLLHPVVHLHVHQRRGPHISAEALVNKNRSSRGNGTRPSAVMWARRKGGIGPEKGGRRGAGPERIPGRALARYLWESDVESELVYMFVTRNDRPPRINREEIDEGKFWKINKIRESRAKGILTPNLEFEFAILLRHIFRERGMRATGGGEAPGARKGIARRGVEPLL